jgi:hypothetical protein
LGSDAPGGRRDAASKDLLGGVMDPITEITLLGGERHRVGGDVKTIEQQILNAARGSIMQLAWVTDAETNESLGINPEHVMTLRAVRSTGQPPASPG